MFTPVRKKLLTRPTLKMVEGTPRYVKIEAPIFIGKEMKSRKADAADAKKREPAHVANVIDLETGEPAQIICSAVVLSTLNDEYPSEAYVGKCFAITKLAKRDGKDYFGYKVEEIEEPAAEPASTAATAARPAIGARR